MVEIRQSGKSDEQRIRDRLKPSRMKWRPLPPMFNKAVAQRELITPCIRAALRSFIATAAALAH
jgi:hypothetical protein